MIEKEHKGLKLKVEGTLLGKIGTLMDEKGTKLFVRNIIAWEGTFMDKKGTTLLFGMIEKEHKGLKLKVEGTLMDEKGTKMIEKEQKGGNA